MKPIEKSCLLTTGCFALSLAINFTAIIFIDNPYKTIIAWWGFIGLIFAGVCGVKSISNKFIWIFGPFVAITMYIAFALVKLNVISAWIVGNEKQ